LIIGLGSSGYASAAFLAQKGAMIKVTDEGRDPDMRERAEMLKKYPVQIETGKHTKDFCAGADIIVVSPGADIRSRELSTVLPADVPVIGELELGFMFCRAPVVAVTGTNGKSTTTELIGNILSVSGRHVVTCGNIGPPFISKVEELDVNSVAVVEVSSFQLETVKRFKPQIAVLLNITEDHYERHHTYDDYKNEKLRIFANQDKNDWAVVHRDLQGNELLNRVRSNVVFFSHNTGPAVIEDGRIVYKSPGGPVVIMNTSEVPIKGGHNMENVMSSIIVSRIMGASLADIRKGIMGFRGLEHRFESVLIRNGVEYIDDSKATNIDATRRALESLDTKAVLIAGGRDKGGDYSSILPLVKEKVKAMVVIGEAREKIKKVFAGSVPVITVNTMKEAVRLASTESDTGDVVLLSPMCSSFDMFSNYKERGALFQREIAECSDSGL